MSQRTQRSQRRNHNASSQSQMNESSSSGNRTLSPRSPESEDYEQYTIASVKFILNHLATKVPIKRADLVKECCNGSSKIFMIILPAVQNRLKSVGRLLRLYNEDNYFSYIRNLSFRLQIYGIIFHELTSVKGSSKQYICFEKNPSVSTIKLRQCDRQNQTLLFIILSYIFAKGESVGEGNDRTTAIQLPLRSFGIQCEFS